MRINKRVFAIFFATFICFVFLQTSVFAREKKSQSKAVVFVVSETTIIPENNNQIDLELDIDQALKKSIDKYLRRRNLSVAATADNADYILKYKLEKVELTWSITTDVSFLFTRRDGELIFTDKLRSRAIRGWRTCVKGISRTMTVKIANKLLETGELTRNMAGTTASVNRAEEGFIAGGNTERLRQERKEGRISETRPGAILAGLSYYPGGAASSHSGNASFEKLLDRNFAVYGKISYLVHEYNDDNGSDSENARGFGSEIGVNVYPNERFWGPYVGVGIGRWALEGHWIAQKTITTGRDKVFYDFNIHIGHKLPVLNKIFLNPSIQFGGLHGPDDRDGFENLDLSLFGWFYYNIGLAVGTSW